MHCLWARNTVAPTVISILSRDLISQLSRLPIYVRSAMRQRTLLLLPFLVEIILLLPPPLWAQCPTQTVYGITLEGETTLGPGTIREWLKQAQARMNFSVGG